jgi:chromosome segregation protein
VHLDEASTVNDIARLKTLITKTLALARSFIQKLSMVNGTHPAAALADKRHALESALSELEKKEESVAREVAALRSKIEGEKDASREAERQLFEAMAQRGQLEGKLSTLRAREHSLAQEETRFKDELREAAALLGVVPHYEDGGVFDEESRSAQEERRRKLERLKIRLEEAGLGNSQEVLKEYHETTERDQFLARELDDLERSAQSLRQLIEELTRTLEERFVGGVDQINKEFDNFFKHMFGGGSASLQIISEQRPRRAVEDPESEDLEIEQGVDITVTIPHKRVKGLHMLSGGERALTSIALIFAMSQVNPPPFLILDETDAALDEANSRRYGDMIDMLAKKSQLILITHNRETMSRAGVLYGVTMGSDGVSKLLSVKFDEAVAVAK